MICSDICSLWLKTKVLVKGLLLGKTKMVGYEKHRSNVVQTTLQRYCKKKMTQEHSGMDAVVLISSCLSDICTVSQLAKHLVTSRVFIFLSLLLVENSTTSHCWETLYPVTSANGVTSNEELLGRPPCTCVMAGHQLLKSCRHATKAQTGQAAHCRSSWIARIIWPTTAKWGCWPTWA